MSEGMSGTTAGHNSKARAGVIRDIIDARRKIEGEIAELMAVRKKNQGRIKSDLGMKVADFNALYRIAELETEDRDQFLDTLREGFEALGIGGQSSFLDAIDPKTAKPGSSKLLPGHKTPTEEEARTLGGLAFQVGDPQDAFPDTIKTKKLKAHFLAGWFEAKNAAGTVSLEEQRASDAEEFGEDETTQNIEEAAD